MNENQENTTEDFMSPDEVTSVNLDALENELGNLSQEELVKYAVRQTKNYKDQALYNQKLNKKLKGEGTESNDTGTETPDEDEKSSKQKVSKKETQGSSPVSSGVSLEEARLAVNYSNEEIEMAKKYASSFDISLSEAVEDPGFKAKLTAKREHKKSSEMSIDDLSTVSSFTTDAKFLELVKQNEDMLKDETHRQRFIELKKKEMRM